MAEVDLVIRGGNVADGTGAPIRQADIAIDDGKIVAVGTVTAKGREEQDATGLLVTPGFVDVHTHYDAQLTWANRLDPSSGHGVTTVVTGNCGMGFAPCRPGDRDSLLKLMEGVEDIPEAVMSAGLPWDWESFGEYLASVERRAHDIDYAVLLPHSPLRVYVMGERALNHEPATAADRAKMRQLACEAMQAGATGFSTSRNLFHQASDGSNAPTLRADEAELREIAHGLADAGRGVLQAISIDGTYTTEEYELLHRVAAASGRPLSYTMLEIPTAKTLWREVINTVERDNAMGADIRMQVFNRPVGVILGLEASFHPFVAHPYYVSEMAKLPLAERVRRMRDPAVRAILLDTSGALQHPLSKSATNFANMYRMGEVANYEPDPAESVAAIAERLGQSPYEVAYDLLLETEGNGMLLVTASNFVEGNLDNTLEIMRHDRSVVALGDGGAHYGLICDASYPTFMLTHWTRDRKRGERLDLAEAIRMLTDAPARLQRFHDRGRIAPGMKADINLIDMSRLKLFSPRVVRDLPADGKRLTQTAEGYVATYVSGVAIRREGQPTGALPGRLVRDSGH